MTEFVLVPKEPTEEMIQAACLSQSHDGFTDYKNWADGHSNGIVERIRGILTADYKAMLSASPTPPEAQGESVREAFEKHYRIPMYIVFYDKRNRYALTEKGSEVGSRTEDMEILDIFNIRWDAWQAALIPSIEQREG